MTIIWWRFISRSLSPTRRNASGLAGSCPRTRFWGGHWRAVQGCTTISANLFSASLFFAKSCEVCLQTDSQELSG